MRFPGFEGEWETKKLGEIGDFKNGINKSSEDFGFGVPFVNLMDIFGKSNISSKEEFSLVNANDREVNLYDLRKGDVLFIRSSVKRSGVGETSVILEDLYKTVYSGFLIRFRDNKIQLNINFKKYCFSTSSFRNRLISLSSTSANTNINQDSLSSLDIYFPTKNEQKKISCLLSLIDDKIQTQNKIIEELKVLKVTLSKKIFSQELRFKDENGNLFPQWEAKKVGEAYSFKSTNSLSRDHLVYQNGDVKNIHYGDIHTKFRTLFDITREVLPYINKNVSLEKVSEENFLKVSDMIFADASEDLNDVGKSIEITNLNNQRVLSGLHTILARPQSGIFSLGFGGYLFKSPQVRFQIQKESQGSKVLSISSGRLSNVKILIPKIAEQIKISNFLSSIDSKLDIESEIFQKLKEQKKFLLQQMFV